MTKLTRRDFLRKLGAIGGIGALHGLDMFTLSGALAQAAGEDYRALVCVFLFGGNDGNNSVVPVSPQGYAEYSAIRKELSIPAQNLAPLAPAAGAADYGLHPQLAPLKDMWDSGAMAVLLNVGTLSEPTTKTAYRAGSARRPDGLFSHSDQQALWQITGSDSQQRSGWGGRIADRLNGVNTAATIPMATSVAGNGLFATGNVTSPLVIPVTGGLKLSGTNNTATDYARRNAMDQLLAIDRESLIVKNAGDVITGALTSGQAVDPILGTISWTVQSHFTGQSSSIARQLMLVAKLIEMRATLGVKRQIFYVTLGGFDTHGNQLNVHSQLLAQLGPALRSFYNATVQLGVASNVTTFTLSDFGRTLQPNSNAGTDHGWGSHHFVIGGAVRGRQFYGQHPVLALDGPDDAGKEGTWIPTTAVDQYVATLATWLGVSAPDLPLIVPNIGRFASSNLGFLA